MNWILQISLLILALSFVLKLIRLALGPSILDRALVLDVLIVTSISLGAFAIYELEDPYLIDFLLVLSIVPFVASVALAKYLGRGKV